MLELSRRSGVARNTIAALERGEGNPTRRHALRARRRARRAALGAAGGAGAGAVRSCAPARALHVDGRRAGGQPARAHRAPGLLGELYAIRFHAGAARHAQPHPFGVEERLHIISGRVRVGPADAPVELGPGDYAPYSGAVPHLYEALDGEAAGTLLILTGGGPAMKRARRMDGIAGFGIDRVAAAALDGRRPAAREPRHRPRRSRPRRSTVTRAALEDPVSNSWLPFTGDLGLRAAISDHIAARHGRVYDPAAEIVVTCGGTEGGARRAAGDARSRRRGRARSTRSTRGSSTACGWRAACRPSRRCTWSTASGGWTATRCAAAVSRADASRC